MSPSSGASGSSSTYSSSICCCSRYFRRSTPSSQPAAVANFTSPSSERRPIEIKVNGLTQLRVPNVALRSAPAPLQQQAPPPLAPPLSATTARSVDSTDDSDVFETARTSRHTPDGKLHKMTDLIRMVRIEEGLEVTPRAPKKEEDSNSHQKSKNMHFHSKPPAKHPRRAVFDEDGDITTRSVTSRDEKTHVFSIPMEHRVSISSLSVPSLKIPSSSSSSSQIIIAKRSTFTRKIAAAPQIVTAFVAFSYACLTMMLTSFSNFFARKK